jgi:Arc/MetJ-type ribon-helix-helix transcriptional regulator
LTYDGCENVRIVGRQKVTLSLSSRCLEVIDQYAETTGFESRSRVVEEAVFAISEFQKYRRFYAEKLQEPKPNTPKTETDQTIEKLMALLDILSKYAGILDRFDRFPSVQQTQEDKPVKYYRLVPPEDRSQNMKPKG